MAAGARRRVRSTSRGMEPARGGPPPSPASSPPPGPPGGAGTGGRGQLATPKASSMAWGHWPSWGRAWRGSQRSPPSRYYYYYWGTPPHATAGGSWRGQRSCWAGDGGTGVLPSSCHPGGTAGPASSALPSATSFVLFLLFFSFCCWFRFCFFCFGRNGSRSCCRHRQQPLARPVPGLEPLGKEPHAAPAPSDADLYCCGQDHLPFAFVLPSVCPAGRPG